MRIQFDSSHSRTLISMTMIHVMNSYEENINRSIDELQSMITIDETRLKNEEDKLDLFSDEFAARFDEIISLVYESSRDNEVIVCAYRYNLWMNADGSSRPIIGSLQYADTPIEILDLINSGIPRVRIPCPEEFTENDVDEFIDYIKEYIPKKVSEFIDDIVAGTDLLSEEDVSVLKQRNSEFTRSLDSDALRSDIRMNFKAGAVLVFEPFEVRIEDSY